MARYQAYALSHFNQAVNYSSTTKRFYDVVHFYLDFIKTCQSRLLNLRSPGYWLMVSKELGMSFRQIQIIRPLLR
ncbi:MAG: hypothetical protein PVJ72_07135 [Gammaproteobacteria bacterium]